MILYIHKIDRARFWMLSGEKNACCQNHHSTQRCVLPVFFLVDSLLSHGSKSTGKETGKTNLCAVGNIHLRRWKIFMIFGPYPLPSAFFNRYYLSVNLVNFWPLLPKKFKRLKWMVPYLYLGNKIGQYTGTYGILVHHIWHLRILRF